MLAALGLLAAFWVIGVIAMVPWSSPDVAGGVTRQLAIALTPTLNSSDLCALCVSVVNPYCLQVR
jgi:hypothetical protein